MGRNTGFAGGCNAGAEAAQRRPAGHPQPRRGAAAGLRRGDPPALARGARLGGLAGAGRRRRGERRSTPPATRSTSPASSGPAATAEPLGEAPPAGRGRRRSPAPAWRSRSRAGAEVGGFPSRVLHVPRGRRPLGAAADGGGDGRDRADARSSPTTTSSAPTPTSGAGSSATASPSSSAPTPARCWPCWRRRCWRPSWRCCAVSAAGGWGGQKLRANLEFLALAAAPPARAPRDPARSAPISAAEFAAWLTPDLDSDLISPLARSLAGAPAAARLLAPGAPAAARSRLSPHPGGEKSDALVRLARSGGSGSR